MTDLPAPRIVSSLGLGPTTETQLILANESAGFVVLVDAGCEPAHRAVVTHVAETVSQRLLTRQNNESTSIVIQSAFDAADAMVRARIPEPFEAGGGIMLLVALATGDALHIAHVGVCRAYILRASGGDASSLGTNERYAPRVTLSDGSTFTCVTTDQSPLAPLVAAGKLDAKAARNHSLRVQPTSALGTARCTPEIITVTPSIGDRVLFCTSKLWETVDDEALGTYLRNAGSAPAACVGIFRMSSAQGPAAPLAVLEYPKALEPVTNDTTRGSPTDAGSGPSDKPLLETIGRDLLTLAREDKLDPVIGRNDEIRRLGQVLIQRRKANALLVGDAGVGKTCIVEGLARWICGPNAPRALRDKRIVEVSIGALISGTKFRGEFEERMQAIVRSAAEDPNLILFIDEFHTIVGAGASGNALDAANILKPALARGELRLIGATTTQEYERHLARDEALARRFELLRIEEPTRNEAIQILDGLRPRFEEHHQVDVAEEALQAAVDLSLRYLPERRLPDKAVDLIDQACAQKVLDAPDEPGEDKRTRVEHRDVALVVAQRQRIPFELVVQGDRERIGDLSRHLQHRILGQTPAIERISALVRKAYLGLREPTRPLASLAFVGPSGVGKTETARILAEYVFGRPESLLRFDMSEYIEKHQIARLIGAPPGYLGHDEEGILTSAVRRRPASVVLFDEIDKAHPDVLSLLLQILDDGNLTDSRGRRASFRETIIVLTANLDVDGSTGRTVGFRGAADAATLPAHEHEKPLRKMLEQRLRPELVGRVQAVVDFRKLDGSAAMGIAEKFLCEMEERLASQGRGIEVSSEVRAKILREAGSSRYGARDIHRLVETEIAKLVDSV